MECINGEVITLKIPKIVTNVAVLHDSDGTVFRVEPRWVVSFPDLARGEALDKVMGGVH